MFILNGLESLYIIGQLTQRKKKFSMLIQSLSFKHSSLDANQLPGYCVDLRSGRTWEINSNRGYCN